MIPIDSASNPAAKPSAAVHCPPCLPFCGLGDSRGLAARLKACGGALLEQTLPAQAEPAASLNRS